MATDRAEQLARRERRDHRHAHSRCRRMVAGGQALSGRRCLHLVSMRRGLPDWRDAARRADCRRRSERRLRVAERRRSCRVPRDARSSGRADIQRALERAGRRTIARGLAAAESIAGRVRNARARRRAATASAVSRRHLVAHSAAEYQPASGRLEHHRARARCQHPPCLPERRRGDRRFRCRARVRRLRSVCAVRRRNRRSAVQGRLAQGSATESRATRKGVDQVPDADA